MKRIWIAIVKMQGWRFRLPEAGSRPELKRCVIVVAPHTSIADFTVGISYLWSLGVNGRVFIKKEFFRWPLGGLLRKMGAIPIDRGNRKNDMVGAAVAAFNSHDDLALVLTPEATRKPVQRWKRGFWEIATQAGVPIVPACIDFGKKEISLFPTIETSGDYDADLARVRGLYKASMAKHPDHFVELNN